MLSEKLDGEITVEKIHFRPFNTIVLKNLLIVDKNPVISVNDYTKPQIDTFFYAEYIIARMSLAGLMDEESLKIASADVKHAQMNLVLEDAVTENDSTITYNNLSRIFRIPKDKVRKEPSPDEIFKIDNISVKDMGFAMLNYSSKPIKYYGGGINWNDMDIRDINVKARDLRFRNGIMSGSAQSVSFREKTGFDVREMSGEVRVGRGKTIIDDLIIKDKWSDIHLEQFMMSYRNVDDFQDFIRLVRLDATILESVVGFKTIACFAPQLEGNSLRADVSGSMSGTVEDFTVSNVQFSSLDGGFSGILNGRMTGIPETYDMWIDAKVSNLRLTTTGLSRFVTQWMRGGTLDLSKFAHNTLFYGRATARGKLNNLNTAVTLSSKDGNLKAEARLDEIIRPDSPITISGAISTEDLNIGRIINSDLAGPATARARMTMTIDDGISVDMDTLKVDRLNLKGYDYRDILAKGSYTPLALNATVISKDPNLNFIFQGGYATGGNDLKIKLL